MIHVDPTLTLLYVAYPPISRLCQRSLRVSPFVNGIILFGEEYRGGFVKKIHPRYGGTLIDPGWKEIDTCGDPQDFGEGACAAIVKDRGDPLAISERLRASRCPAEQWEPPVQESISTASFLPYRFLASPDEEGPSSSFPLSFSHNALTPGTLRASTYLICKTISCPWRRTLAWRIRESDRGHYFFPFPTIVAKFCLDEIQSFVLIYIRTYICFGRVIKEILTKIFLKL